MFSNLELGQIHCLKESLQGGTAWYLKPIIPQLTHWGRVTHICVGKLTIIGSDNGLSPVRRQAIIWTNAGILLIRPLGTNFSEILIGIQPFYIQENVLENVVCEMASICLGINVLKCCIAHSSSSPARARHIKHISGGTFEFKNCEPN